MVSGASQGGSTDPWFVFTVVLIIVAIAMAGWLYRHYRRNAITPPEDNRPVAKGETVAVASEQKKPPYRIIVALACAMGIGFALNTFVMPVFPAYLLGAAAVLGYTVVRIQRAKPKRTMGEKRFHAVTSETHFSDIAGLDDTVEEFREVVEFLRDPSRLNRFGGKISQGWLLIGPPGNGKTLLARAVAGEAGVPFISCAGSEFVNKYVGVGADAVRKLFAAVETQIAELKKTSGESDPAAIVFIDEIDAIGKKRTGEEGGGRESETTLNQLLVELDGFEKHRNVIVLAATNRVEILDDALVRPGRFDRKIMVHPPDRNGRVAILRLYAKDKRIGNDVRFEKHARLLPGASGADLAYLVNEAALVAARRVSQAEDAQERGEDVSDEDLREELIDSDFHEAIMRLLAGSERKSHILSDRERKIVAVHEAGHTFVAQKLAPPLDPPEEVMITTRGMALGVTMVMSEETDLMPRNVIEARMAVLSGGMVAEELVFGKDKVTTGSTSDRERATQFARAMEMQYGMGILEGELKSSRTYGTAPNGMRDFGDATASRIDEAVAKRVHAAEEQARKILTENLGQLKALAKLLNDRETLDRGDLDKFFAGEHLPDDNPPAEAVAEDGHAPNRNGGADDAGWSDGVQEFVSDLVRKADEWLRPRRKESKIKRPTV